VIGQSSHVPANPTQEQTGGSYRGSALKRLALFEAVCQGASEDFVPPAAQRKVVGRTNNGGKVVFRRVWPARRFTRSSANRASLKAESGLHIPELRPSEARASQVA